MKNFFILLLFLTSFSSITAQSSRNMDNGLVKVNMLLPGVSYEIGARNNTTFSFDLRLIPLANGSILELYPAVGAKFRYYTNMKRRENLNKNITGNSGNYISFLNQILVAAPVPGKLEHNDPISYNAGFVYRS